MLDGLTEGVIRALIAVLRLLPESPIAVALADVDTTDIYQWLGYVNWLLPIGACIRITTGWLTAVAVYYGYQIVLRWLRVIA